MWWVVYELRHAPRAARASVAEEASSLCSTQELGSGRVEDFRGFLADIECEAEYVEHPRSRCEPRSMRGTRLCQLAGHN
jgi:hypothetical protein